MLFDLIFADSNLVTSVSANNLISFNLQILQRHRYVEAYQVDSKLQTLEEDFISRNQNDAISYKVRSMSHWRKGLVVSCLIRPIYQYCLNKEILKLCQFDLENQI